MHFSFPPFGLHFYLLRTASRLLADFFYLLFVYIWPYRRKLILRNLSKSFPAYSKKHKKKLTKAYYRHLADLITEPFLISLTKKKDLAHLVRYENVSLIRDLLKDGKDVMLLAAHYGNWEYLLSLPTEIDGDIFAAYSPVSQCFFNDKLKQMRSRFGIHLIRKQDWYRETLRQVNARPAVYISVSDQRPPVRSKLSLTFLNQKTFVQSGVARIGRKRSAVMVYVDVNKQDRNSYAFRFRIISESGSNISDEELINIYYKHLEKTIHRHPELWLWSHNRWKF